MLILTAKIILIGGLFGVGFIVWRKIPALALLAESEIRPLEKKENFLKKEKIFSKLKNFKNFKKEKNPKEDKPDFSNDYWEKIRRG